MNFGLDSQCVDLTFPSYAETKLYFMGSYTTTTSMQGFYVAEMSTDTNILNWKIGYEAKSLNSSLVPQDLLIDGSGTFLYVIGSVSLLADLQEEIFYAKISITRKAIVKFMMQGCALKRDAGVSFTLDRYRTSIYSLSEQNCYFKAG